MSLWLTKDELVELTGFRQRERQIEALTDMGVRFRLRPADRFPLVERNQFDTLPKHQRRAEPKFNAAR